MPRCAPTPRAAAIATLMVLTLLAGCSSSSHQAVTRAPTSPSASPSATSSIAPATATPSRGVVTSFYVRADRDRFWVEPETHTVAVTHAALASAAFTQVIAGHPTDPTLSTLAPIGTRVLGIALHVPVLTLDLSGAVRRHPLGALAEGAFAQQLAHTAAQFSGVTQLLVRVDGAAIMSLWGHLDWSKPITPDPYALTPVELTSPAYGATVPAGPLTVHGIANNVFEGVVSLELRNPAGVVVEHPSVQARQDRLAPWSWRFSTLLTPGHWSVTGYEVSAKDGHRIGESTRPLTVI